MHYPSVSSAVNLRIYAQIDSLISIKCLLILKLLLFISNNTD